jgi:hypothetical protein
MESSTEKISQSVDTSARRWKPMSRDQRRILGVLIEKSKTTPDVYPMSINGIKNGSNQKSNRSPLLELEENRIEDVLYELRQLGCVIEVHAGGRVPKYKHQAYEWLEVTKAELSVLTELLLRGEQTIGDLRARAARMESSIEGLDELRPILASLKQKELLVELTPPGRGQVVTHNLYLPNELERLQLQFKGHQAQAGDSDEPGRPSHSPSGEPSTLSRQSDQNLSQRVFELETKVAELHEQLVQLRQRISP